MEEELKEIAMKMDEFSNKYNCKINVEAFCCTISGDEKAKLVYKLKAIKPEQILTEIII